MTRKAHAFVSKVLYPITIASMVLWSLGPAAFPVPAYAAITRNEAVALATGAQSLGVSSSPTAVFGLNLNISAGETFSRARVVIDPSNSFDPSGDLAAIAPGATSGIELYDDAGATSGSFDATDQAIISNNSIIQNPRFSKLALGANILTLDPNVDTTLPYMQGQLVFANVTANAASTGAYAWHIVTANGTGTGAGTTLRLDGNTTAAPTFLASSRLSMIDTPAFGSGSFTINGTSNTTTYASTAATASLGDIIYYQTGTTAGRWGVVTTNFNVTAASVNGANLANGTYKIAKFPSITGSFVVPASGSFTPTGAYGTTTTPVVGDLVLFQQGTGDARWGMVTNNTLSGGSFAINGMTLAAGTYRISTLDTSGGNQMGFQTALMNNTSMSMALGELSFVLTTQNPAATDYGWHITTTGATGVSGAGAGTLRLDNATAAPTYGWTASLVPDIAQAVAADELGANEGNDYFVAIRTSAGAQNGRAVRFIMNPGDIVFSANTPTTTPTLVSSPTYTVSTTAQQSQSAGANTTVMDMTNGFLRLKQSSNFKAVARVQFGSTDAAKTLTSIAISFATANSTTPTWTASAATSSELLDLAATGGGISLWKDGGSPGFGLNGAGDTQVTLAASPVYGASNAFTITPATAPTIASDDVYFIVLKSDTSGVTNNNAFTVNMATNAITTSGTSPTIGVFSTPPIAMDTTAPTIASVSDVPGQSTKLSVRFSEPVQKINAAGALTTTDLTYTNDATDGSGRTVSSISHNPGADIAELTMSGALVAGDFDGTPSSLAAGTSKIEDMAGNVMGTTARNLGSPLIITTSVIPATYVGSVYDATTPLVTFAASGGTGAKTFSGNTQADTDALVALLGASPLAGATGKLTGTVQQNTAGTRNVTIKVTDGVAATATKQFTINVAATQGGDVPGLTNVTPPSGSQGATNLSVAITGTNTSFTSASAVAFLLNGTADTNITVGTVTANSATSITVPVTIAAGAATGSRDVRVTTGNQVVIMPSGFNVTGAVAAGLNLVFPTDSATGIQLPQPGFNFNPSTNTTFTHYRIVLSATQDFATALWNYVFPKPDTLGTNGSHCSATSCNVNYSAGNFLTITPASTLTSNTTYYWKVETYQDPTPTTQFASTDVIELNRRENTPVRSFTTSASVTDVQPPQIEHRPIVQARANAVATVYARVLDNVANANTTPALATTLSACAGTGCTPSTSTLPSASATDGVVAGTLAQNGYYSYVLPSAFITATVGTVVRYYITASDGTNTSNFYQSGGTTPFQFTTTAAIATSGVTITGTVKDTSDTCATGVQGALVFAEGSGFSATTGADCAYTLGAANNGLAVGFPYDLVVARDGYSTQRRDAVLAGSTSVAVQLGQGATGGFGGDTTRPRVLRSMPGDKMQNMPGNDSNMRILVVFDKPMSQSSVLTNGNMVVNSVNVQTGVLTNITPNGSWAYYSTYTMPFGGTESNVAVWSFTGTNTFGDNKTIAVKVTPSVTDSSGNAVQGNLTDGSYSFSFTTGSTATSVGFNTATGTFADGGVFGQGQNIAPHVTTTAPSMGSPSVPRNTKIMINFDTSMADDAAGTYTLASAVKLFEVSSAGAETDVTSSAINAVTLTSDKMAATVTLKTTYPSACTGASCGVFKATTRYRLKVLGSAKAANGMTMRAPGQETQVAFMSDFTTSASSDTVAPTIVGSDPTTNATDVPSMLGSVSVSFDKDMDSSSLTTSTMTLTTGSTAVTGTVDYRPMERTAYFIPSRVLTPTTQYTLTLTAGVRGINGTAIAAATRAFTTGSADTSAPTVTSLTADDTNISISFSKPMNSSPATDTTNFTSSVLRVASYTVKYGTAGFNAATAGTTLTLPATAQISYDGKNNSVMISGYRPTSTTAAQVQGQQLYVAVANAKDIGGNAISTSGTAPDTANTSRATVQNSATTQGQLGPMTITNDMMKAVGDFKPITFSSATFGFAPQTEVRPFNMMTGTTTIYGVHLSLSRQIPDGGAIVLTFPQGFNVSGAKQDINSPKRRDINGPGTGTVTFKCQTNVAGMSAKSCGGGAANADDTGTAQGGLADDGVVVNANARTITIYVSGATNSEGHDVLDFDIAGIVNSTVPKDFNTTGYTVSIATKNGTTNLETLSSVPFFIQSAGTTTYTLTGTITATNNDQNGTISVFLDSPMTGPLEATSADFAGGQTATYSFTNLPPGDYGLRTEPYVKINDTTEFLGKFPERVMMSANTVRNFTLSSATAAGTGTSVTVSVDGPSSEPIDIFANGPAGFRVMQKTLDTNAGAENFTIRLSNGDWFLGVGPQMPKGQMSGPPPSPSYLPPRPVNIRINGGVCTIEGTETCTKAFTLTASTKQIRGVVKDLANKVIANAEVYAYSPAGASMGNFAKTDTTGTFILNITEGVFNVGAMIQGMPPSKEVPVEVTSHTTTYLKIDGAQAAIRPDAAATAFVLKLAKPDYTISGKVTDGTNVINGASVYAYKQGAPGHATAPTDSSGNYSLFVSTGTWKVGVFLPKYGNLTEQTVTVTTANATDINFSPTGTGTFYAVSGTVTVGGVAREGAQVRIKNSGYFNDTRTDSLGAYSFNVPQGTGYIVDGFVPGVGELAPLTAFDVSAAVENKNLTVATLRTITMTFSSSVANAFVELRSTTGSNIRKQIKNSTTGTLSAPDGSYIVNVDLQGAPIPFTAVAATDGNTTYASATGVVTVNGDEGLTVTVPTLRALTITVQDGSSVALADAWVELMNPTSGEHFGSKTGTNGQATLRAADGTYFINAMKPGYYRAPTSLTVSANAAQTLTLTAATRTIAGTVYIGSTGAANSFVRAEKQGGGFGGAMTDANGQYTLSVAEGIWRVFAKAEGYAEAELSATVDTTTASATGKDITLTTTVTVSAPKSKPMTPSTGGSIEDTSAGIKVNVPANALGSSSSAGNMQVKKTTNFTKTETARPVAAVEISATDANGTPIKTLTESVTVELSYTKAELATTASSSDTSINTKSEIEKLDVGFWDESVSNWTTLPTTTTYVDSAGAVVTSPSEDLSNVASVKLSALTDHFSLFAPVVPTDPSAPSTPTNFATGTATTTTIVLGWSVVSGATGYNIYRSTSSTGTFSRLGSEPTVSSGSTGTYTDSGLSASQTFYYKISALNNNGESAASSALSATSAATTSSSTSSGGVVSSSSSSSQTTTTTTTATAITATNVSVTNTNTVAVVTKGITASTLGVSAINAANLEVKQTGAATTATTEKKDVAAQQLKDMKSVDATEKKAQDALATLESMVTKGTVAPLALSQNVTRYEVKEKTTGKTASVTRVEQLFAPTKDTKDVTIVMTVPKSVAERASLLTFTGVQPEVLQDDPILRWTFAEVKAGETKDLSYQANKNLEKLEVKNVAVAAVPAFVEMAWGFKDGKFQLMPKTEADALHAAAEASAAAKAPAREEKKAEVSLEKKAAAMPAKAAAKPLVAVKALPHLSAKAAKVVTNVLKRSAIILLPEAKGAAYYLDPKTQKRASLGRPAEAFEVMRSFGIGITNNDLEKIPESTKEGDTAFACKHAGKIFLQVQAKGEAWYVHPENCKRYFLNRPADAFNLMRKLALGVSNADADAIPTSEKSKPVTPATPAQPAQPKEDPKKASDKLSPLARPLYSGMKGDDVKTLQTILTQKGYYTGTVSGTMDEATFTAVRQMQLKEGLVKSVATPGYGTVGPATRAFVNKLLQVEPEPKKETTPAAPKQSEGEGESALDKLKRLMKQ
ncbi:Ig-like domain-containing protein [Candidatus Uhrbacteria bacterium]|nr:Ig-like domain-containing protein [Candidatus Uhrbacteria bacterium]